MPGKKIESSAQDVTDLLHKDHQAVRELFWAFTEAEGNKEQEELVQSILTELFVHSTVEEEIVYPVVKKKADDGADLIGEANNEHRVVKFLMAELSQMSASDEEYKAKVTVLCELVNHRVQEEEKKMFKKLRDSGADLAALAKKVQERKVQLEKESLPSMHATLEIGAPAKAQKSSEMSSRKPSTAKPKRKSA